MLKKIRIIFQTALAGAVTFGAIFGFFIKGYDLEIARLIGAFLAISLVSLYMPQLFKQD